MIDGADPGTQRNECPGPCLGEGEPVWCGLCSVQLRKRMLALPELARLAGQNGDGHRSGPDNERVGGGSVEAPTNSPTHDNLDQLQRELENVRDDLRSASNPERVNGRGIVSVDNLQSVVSWLSVRWDLAIKSPLCGERLGKTVHVWFTRLVRETKSGAEAIDLPLACPRCETRSLKLWDGDQVVRCANGRCKAEMTADDYDRYRRALETWERQANERAADPTGNPRFDRRRTR